MNDGDKKKKKSEANHPMTSTRLAPSGAKPPVYDIIGRRLRDYFDEISREPVPDRFLELLHQLETAKKKEP